MALAASGVLSNIIAAAKKTLGQCTAWQSWTGDTGDETNATLHIIEFEKEWEEATVTAGRDVRCMIKIENPRRVRTTANWQCVAVFHFEAPVSSAYAADPEQAFREFTNNLGATVDEMCTDALADTAGTLLALRPDEMSIDGPYRTPESENQTDDDVIWADVKIPAGPAG